MSTARLGSGMLRLEFAYLMDDVGAPMSGYPEPIQVLCVHKLPKATFATLRIGTEAVQAAPVVPGSSR